MRNIIAAVIMVIGIGNLSAYNTKTKDEYQTADKIYKTFTFIDINELPSNIREILYFEFKDYIVKSVEVKTVNNSNIYQVTLLDIENFEHYIYINEQGEIIE